MANFHCVTSSQRMVLLYKVESYAFCTQCLHFAWFECLFFCLHACSLPICALLLWKLAGAKHLDYLLTCVRICFQRDTEFHWELLVACFALKVSCWRVFSRERSWYSRNVPQRSKVEVCIHVAGVAAYNSLMDKCLASTVLAVSRWERTM